MSAISDFGSGRSEPVVSEQKQDLPAQPQSAMADSSAEATSAILVKPHRDEPIDSDNDAHIRLIYPNFLKRRDVLAGSTSTPRQTAVLRMNPGFISAMKASYLRFMGRGAAPRCHLLAQHRNKSPRVTPKPQPNHHSKGVWSCEMGVKNTTLLAPVQLASRRVPAVVRAHTERQNPFPGPIGR